VRPQGSSVESGTRPRLESRTRDGGMKTTILALVLVIAAALVLTFASPALAEQYLCVPDKATGFFYNKNMKEWQTTTLNVSQFVISPSTDRKFAYRVKDMEEKALPGYCDKDFNEAGILVCETFGGDLRFNKTNGRFLRVFEGAYYTVGIPGPFKESDEDSGTPMIEIGKCTSF
jgi:hypothetical protein